jgi:beta-glucanase (GH16 family)
MKNLPICLMISIPFIFSNCGKDETNDITGFVAEIPLITESNSTGLQSINVKVKGNLVNDISASYKFLEGTARFTDDLISTTGEVTLKAGTPTASVPIEIVGDSFFELTESFVLVMEFEGKSYPINIEIKDDDELGNIQESEDGFTTPVAYPSMQLVWNDEFGDASLNTSVWTHELGNGCNVGICGWGNNELESYTSDPSNIKLENGFLKITAQNNAGSYTSARIKTQSKKNFQYGRIDVRAKLPKGKGIWPAIWMLGENITSVNWPTCGEIDIMELVGHRAATSHGTVHFSNDGYKSSTGSTTLLDGDFSDKFHVFSLVWDRSTITWYVDNKSFKTFNSTTATFEKPFFFLFNVAVGGNWPGSPDASTVFPQEMQVDYVRVFK